MTPEGVQHVAITGFSWSTVLIGVLNLLVGGALVTWIKQRPKMREIEVTEGSALRQAFVTEMRALRDEIKDLRDETKELRDENTALRKEVRDLHGVIDGMRREALQAGISTQRAVVSALPRGVVPESTLAALDRIDPIKT